MSFALGADDVRLLFRYALPRLLRRVLSYTFLLRGSLKTCHRHVFFTLTFDSQSASPKTKDTLWVSFAFGADDVRLLFRYALPRLLRRVLSYTFLLRGSLRTCHQDLLDKEGLTIAFVNQSDLLYL